MATVALRVGQRFALACGVVGVVVAGVVVLFGPDPYSDRIEGYLDAAVSADATAAAEFVCAGSRDVVLGPAWAIDAAVQRDRLALRRFDRRRGGADRAVVLLHTATGELRAEFDVGTEGEGRCVVVEPGRPFGVAVDVVCRQRAGIVCVDPSG